jgi:hypothetical protein
MTTQLHFIHHLLNGFFTPVYSFALYAILCLLLSILLLWINSFHLYCLSFHLWNIP